MAFAYSLCSSSKGNSTYIGDEKNGILVDAGLSLRSFKQKMDFRGIDYSAVKGIFITHEHTDHIKGLKTIGKLLNVPIYSSRKTIEHLIKNDMLPPGGKAIELNRKVADMGNMGVTSFTTPHDSVHSLGFKMEFTDGKTAVVCTDLGCVTQEVSTNIMGSNFILLESNYDEEMLRMGAYPSFLKQRIRSSVGHLSNENCAKTLVELLQSGTTKFMLGHLSEQNNLPQLAMQCALAELLHAGSELNRDYILSVAKAQSIGEVMEI
ncbi:MAG: MBL fold metallo-hydrolase [Oscillospiraceae bacterium]